MSRGERKTLVGERFAKVSKKSLWICTKGKWWEAVKKIKKAL